jgi:hypothetical protein
MSRRGLLIISTYIREIPVRFSTSNLDIGPVNRAVFYDSFNFTKLLHSLDWYRTASTEGNSRGLIWVTLSKFTGRTEWNLMQDFHLTGDLLNRNQKWYSLNHWYNKPRHLGSHLWYSVHPAIFLSHLNFRTPAYETPSLNVLRIGKKFICDELNLFNSSCSLKRRITLRFVFLYWDREQPSY